MSARLPQLWATRPHAERETDLDLRAVFDRPRAGAEEALLRRLTRERLLAQGRRAAPRRDGKGVPPAE